MNTITLEQRSVNDLKGLFYIPAYQRGYRWKDEVKLLLDDISDFDSSDKNVKYSLQPIVVKNISSGSEIKYEVVDGQQRITTIFLIFNYIKNQNVPLELQFNIEYETRPDSKKFLAGISVRESENIENIDAYYMQEAYNMIDKWFKKKPIFATSVWKFYQKITEKVSIIWYETTEAEDPIKLFSRLNIGRIPLTNSELIKALLLSRDDSLNEQKQLECAIEWDRIEKGLRDSRFWAFLTNKRQDEYPSRIDFLFELIFNINRNEISYYGQYAIFYYFSDRMKKEGKINKELKVKLWGELQNYFLRLKEWYENRDLYHKIGYLLTSECITLQDLVKETDRNKKKSVFCEFLDKKIAFSIKGYEFYELSYENNSKEMHRLLLLFNVESVRQIKDDDHIRFPFNQYKKGWSLEHIHAQHSEGLNKKEQWVAWLELHGKSLRNLPRIKDDGIDKLIGEIATLIKDPKLDKGKFQEIARKTVKILSLEKDEDAPYLHSLSNMALLKTEDNAALSNATFDVKRTRIIELDKEGHYIPLCTRRVFLKYYTSQDSQIHFWGKEDREKYIENIKDVLKSYLSNAK